MSRQVVMNRRGKAIGYIDTARDGRQSAVCGRGTLVAVFDPRVSETLGACGGRISEGNRLQEMLRQLR